MAIDDPFANSDPEAPVTDNSTPASDKELLPSDVNTDESPASDDEPAVDISEEQTMNANIENDIPAEPSNKTASQKMRDEANAILAKHGGLTSNIPLNSPYWHLRHGRTK